MKKGFKLFGFLVLMAVIGLACSSCDNMFKYDLKIYNETGSTIQVGVSTSANGPSSWTTLANNDYTVLTNLKSGHYYGYSRFLGGTAFRTNNSISFTHDTTWTVTYSGGFIWSYYK